MASKILGQSPDGTLRHVSVIPGNVNALPVIIVGQTVQAVEKTTYVMLQDVPNNVQQTILSSDALGGKSSLRWITIRARVAPGQTPASYFNTFFDIFGGDLHLARISQINGGQRRFEQDRWFDGALKLVCHGLPSSSTIDIDLIWKVHL